MLEDRVHLIGYHIATVFIQSHYDITILRQPKKKNNSATHQIRLNFRHVHYTDVIIDKSIIYLLVYSVVQKYTFVHHFRQKTHENNMTNKETKRTQIHR